MAQRARYPGQDASRADVGVLVERLADREPQAPEADVIRHLGRADRAEIDGVMALDLRETVRRHHHAGRPIMVRSPPKMIEAPLDPALALRDRLQHLEASRNDFFADSVAGNDRDPIASHGVGSGVSGSWPYRSAGAPKRALPYHPAGDMERQRINCGGETKRHRARPSQSGT